MKKLERSLGLSAVVAISVSAMLGSGIFVLPGIAIATTGPSVWLAYTLAAIAVLPAAMSKSELATAMPTSGGTYVYLERSFGPVAGTVAGLGLWLSLLLKSAFALVGFGAYLSVLADIPLIPTSLTILTIITILNILGVGKVSNLLIIIVSVCIASLISISGFSIFNFNSDYLFPMFPLGIKGIMAATALVFVSFAGVTKVAAIAEEIKDPEKNLPRGILISLGIVTVVYSSVTFILVGNFPYEELAGNIKPIYHLALKVGGPFIGSALAVIAVITMSSMTNAGILAASRFPFAMSRDNLLPGPLGRLHDRFMTPYWSIICSGLIVAISITTMDVAKIAKMASVFMLLIYLAENIAVIVLRESRVQWYIPTFKSPLYPALQIFGIISIMLLLMAMGLPIILPAMISITIPGLLLFFFYSRKRTTRKGVIGMRGKREDLVLDENSLQEATPLRPSRLENIDLSMDANVVVALFGKERSPEMLIEMGTGINQQGNLEVAHITEVPEQTDLSDISDDPAELRSLRRRVIAMAMEKKEPITFDPVVSHDITKTIYEISQRLHCQWLLMEWAGKNSSGFTVHNPVGWLKDHLQCHLGIFRDAGVRYIRKIVIFLRDENNDPLALETADHLAKVNQADLTLIKILPSDTPDEVYHQIEKQLLNLVGQCASPASVRLEMADNPIESMIASTVEYDLLLFGQSKNLTFFQKYLGSDDDRLIAKAACSVISIHTRRQYSFDDEI